MTTLITILLSLGLFMIVETEFGFAIAVVAFIASFAIQKALYSMFKSMVEGRQVRN